MFKNADAAFLKLVALACKPIFFLSGQCILKKGDLGHAVSYNLIYTAWYRCISIITDVFH